MRTLNLSIVHRALSTVNLLGALCIVLCTSVHAETTVIPHPFTVGMELGTTTQVPYAVYFTDQNFGRDVWKESYVDGQRLLEVGEWEYVLTKREINGHTADQLRGWATIIKDGGEIKQLGLVLLPDDWGYTHHFSDNVWYENQDYTGKVFNLGNTFSNNVFTETDWAAMQQAGAVFLPCEISDKIYGNGDYWSSTKNDVTGISYAFFKTSSTTPATEIFQFNTDGVASQERFIRLVQDNVTITLNEEVDNADLLTQWQTSGNPVNVYLIRSLTPGMYNTFCLPFDLTEQEVTETFGAEAKVAKFTNGTLSEDKQTLEIAFESCTTIEAGTPYLIEPTQGMINPTFYNRVIQKTSADGENFSPQGAVAHLGIINPHHIPDGDMKYLFLQANNQLIWSKAGDASSMKGMRGYFYVPDMQDMPANCPARLSVRQATHTPTDLNRFTDSPTPQFTKYIKDGQLVIIKDNKMYNILGM
ncbi:MAG: hypothetical protein KBS40_03085 [Bacteroidales bacterium]|nr:hypothetical protein [Bacteroidales bacterium]